MIQGLLKKIRILLRGGKAGKRTLFAGTLRLWVGFWTADDGADDWYCSYKVREGEVLKKTIEIDSSKKARYIELTPTTKTAVVIVRYRKGSSRIGLVMTYRVRLFKDYEFYHHFNYPETISFPPPETLMHMVL